MELNLERFCGVSPRTNEPMTATVRGVTWNFATDGCMAIGIAVESSGLKEETIGASRVIQECMAAQTATSVEELREAFSAGRAIDLTPCKFCHGKRTVCDSCCGSGERTCPHCGVLSDCRRCYGSGYEPCGACNNREIADLFCYAPGAEVLYDGEKFDANRVLTCLDSFRGKCRVSVRQVLDKHRIDIIGDGDAWFVSVAGFYVSKKLAT